MGLKSARPLVLLKSKRDRLRHEKVTSLFFFFWKNISKASPVFLVRSHRGSKCLLMRPGLSDSITTSIRTLGPETKEGVH